MIRNYQLESQAKEVEVEVETWKEKVVEVNRKRRVFQVSSRGTEARRVKGSIADTADCTYAVLDDDVPLVGIYGETFVDVGKQVARSDHRHDPARDG